MINILKPKICFSNKIHRLKFSYFGFHQINRLMAIKMHDISCIH